MEKLLEVREFDSITGNADYKEDERYKYLFSTEDNIFYMNALSVLDATMSVGVGVMTLGYEVYVLVVYMDGETYKSTSNMEEIKDRFMKYVNGFMNTH